MQVTNRFGEGGFIKSLLLYVTPDLSYYSERGQGGEDNTWNRGNNKKKRRKSYQYVVVVPLVST